MKPLDLPDGMTLREIADRLGCTFQNVQQHERRALRKLRLGLLRSGLSEADARDLLREMAQRHR